MEFKKILIFVLFGIPALIILAILIAIGGVVGGGLSILLAEQFGNVLIASLAGATAAGVVFQAFFTRLMDAFSRLRKEGDGGQPGDEKRKMYSGNPFWGSIAYFAATIIGVNLTYAFVTNPAWIAILGIGLSGALGLGGLWLVDRLKLFRIGMTKEQN